LWYSAIAMLLLIEIIIERSNYLRLDCILTSSWINMFRNTIFLMTEKWEVRWLILVSWTYMSLHAHLISYVLSSTWLCNMTLFCNMFRWTCNKLMYISVFNISMLILLNAFAKFLVCISCLTVLSLCHADIKLMLQMQFLISLQLSTLVSLLWRLFFM